MKLNIISEAGINRRHFLKGASAVLVQALTGAGVPINIAQKLATKSPLAFVSYYPDWSSTSQEEAVEILDMVKKAAQVLNTDSMAVITEPGDMLTFETGLDQGRLAQLMQQFQPEVNVYDDVCEMEFTIAGKKPHLNFDISVRLGLDLEQDSIPFQVSDEGIIRSWWEVAGQYVDQPISDVFGNILKKFGIDTTKIDPTVRESIKERLFENGPEWMDRYGDLSKYGFSKREIAELKQIQKRKFAEQEAQYQEYQRQQMQMPSRDLDIQGWENEGGYAMESFKKRLAAIFG